MAAGTRVLKDRYELLGLVATGGMGQVWRGRDLLLGRAVAVKVLRGGLTGDASFLTRFRAEAQHAAMLNHPNIAGVHDYGEEVVDDGGEPLAFLVMELVEGESLAALLERTGRLDVPLTLSIVRQTAAALAAAHAAGVVHRDVKPGNVLVRPDGVVKITDFGIAWSASSVPLTRTGQVVGTAHYLSPEQAQGGKASPASDVYALGAVAYECLAGRRAFDGENSVQIALMQIRDEPPPLPADVPAPVRTLVEHAMAKDPALRIPDGAAFVAAVDALPPLAPGTGPTTTQRLPPAGTPVPARPVAGPLPTAVLPAGVLAGGSGTPPPDGEPVPERGGRRRTAVLVAAVALLAVALAAAVVAGTRSSSSRTPAATAPVTTAAPTTSAAPATTDPGVPVDPAALVGRPVDQVRGQLTELGLVPRLTAVTTSSVPSGQVTAVGPTGVLARGSEVTVSYAVAPSTSAAPAPTSAPAPAPAPTPAKPTKPTKTHGRKGGDG